MDVVVPVDSDSGRALASRIDRLLGRLEREGKNLDRFSADQVQLAIECLRRHVYAIAGDALDYAERAADEAWEDQGFLARVFPTNVLRHHFERTWHEIEA